jgi:hypothetical protein
MYVGQDGGQPDICIGRDGFGYQSDAADFAAVDLVLRTLRRRDTMAQIDLVIPGSRRDAIRERSISFHA